MPALEHEPARIPQTKQTTCEAIRLLLPRQLRQVRNPLPLAAHPQQGCPAGAGTARHLHNVPSALSPGTRRTRGAARNMSVRHRESVPGFVCRAGTPGGGPAEGAQRNSARGSRRRAGPAAQQRQGPTLRRHDQEKRATGAEGRHITHNNPSSPRIECPSLTSSGDPRPLQPRRPSPGGRQPRRAAQPMPSAGRGTGCEAVQRSCRVRSVSARQRTSRWHQRA
jgi:hypothetical protein